MALLVVLAGCHRPEAPPKSGKKIGYEKRQAPFHWGGSGGAVANPRAVAEESEAVPWVPNDPSVRLALERFRNGSDSDRLAIAGLLMEMGTEESITGLVLVLRNLPAGEVKSLICQKLEKLEAGTGREFLLGLLLVDADQEVARALTSALGSQADEALIDRLVALYDAVPDPGARDRLLDVLSQGTTDRIAPAIGALINDEARGLADPLMLAAGRALADNASAQALDVLLGKLSKAGKQAESSEFAGIVAGIWRPRAHHALLYAAEGNKIATAPASRIAAIRALKNFPGEETTEVLTRVASDPDKTISAAAREVVAGFVTADPNLQP